MYTALKAATIRTGSAWDVPKRLGDLFQRQKEEDRPDKRIIIIPNVTAQAKILFIIAFSSKTELLFTKNLCNSIIAKKRCFRHNHKCYLILILERSDSL
jgi:hypothetical protein